MPASAFVEKTAAGIDKLKTAKAKAAIIGTSHFISVSSSNG
jgi:hypothetical protein